MRKTYNVALIGLGQIGFLNYFDKKMNQLGLSNNHATIINKHKGFNFKVGVDIDTKKIEKAKKIFPNTDFFKSIYQIKDISSIDVVVIATPPEKRMEIIKYFKDVKAMIIEKPTSTNLKENNYLLKYFKKNKIIVQVNLPRRADNTLIMISKTKLRKIIGQIQFIQGTYGNGLFNNGPHMVDLLRMLTGFEITSAQALTNSKILFQGPLKNNINVPFILNNKERIPIVFNILDFKKFRETSIDIWGTKARLEILQEGFNIRISGIDKCRSAEHSKEINFDIIKKIKTNLGNAMYNIYDDLHMKLINKKNNVCSPLISSLKNEKILFAIHKSQKLNGKKIIIN